MPSFTLGADEQLLAWDEMGFILGFWEDALGGVWVRRVDDAGEEIGRAQGTLVASRHDGELLLSRRVNRGLSFHMADPTLTVLTDLEWAPVAASGQVKPASWAGDGRFAFITIENRTNLWRLEIFGADGEPLAVQEITGRIWDVEWSPDGRFVVMPGFDTQGERGHLIFVYDSVEDSLHQIEFDARVAAVTIRPWRPES